MHIAMFIVYSSFYSMWLHSWNISFNITCNIWWAAAKLPYDHDKITQSKIASPKLDFSLREIHEGWDLGQRLNLNVRFDWLNTEIYITLLRKLFQMVDMGRNLLHAMLHK